MITLSNTKFGTRRRAIIGGVNFNVLMGYMELTFFVQLIDSNSNLLDDKSLTQNRMVVYSVSNQNRVDAQFNPLQSGGNGEYDYFNSLMQNEPLPGLIIKLAEKLKLRGIFD